MTQVSPALSTSAAPSASAGPDPLVNSTSAGFTRSALAHRSRSASVAGYRASAGDSRPFSTAMTAGDGPSGFSLPSRRTRGRRPAGPGSAAAPVPPRESGPRESSRDHLADGVFQDVARAELLEPGHQPGHL